MTGANKVMRVPPSICGTKCHQRFRVPQSGDEPTWKPQSEGDPSRGRMVQCGSDSLQSFISCLHPSPDQGAGRVSHEMAAGCQDAVRGSNKQAGAGITEHLED